MCDFHAIKGSMKMKKKDTVFLKQMEKADTICLTQKVKASG